MENKALVGLNQEEMYEVEGGEILATTLGALGTAWVIYELGYAVGKGIAHFTS